MFCNRGFTLCFLSFVYSGKRNQFDEIVSLIFTLLFMIAIQRLVEKLSSFNMLACLVNKIPCAFLRLLINFFLLISFF